MHSVFAICDTDSLRSTRVSPPVGKIYQFLQVFAKICAFVINFIVRQVAGKRAVLPTVRIFRVTWAGKSKPLSYFVT